ncbi:hypothetical protein POJ06DRAFT_259958 [Lipomyces tetrasporus]|uniref:Uncharacterized protein n=1 Tax=Lipomyces tetrasporus TaxID=54092 RepID=A0AAD7QQ12_9ASCO|nr:uncharacterized protein POJ06DRAFT_259958 [Lipomyces tetrasporus]KAJ8097757.1 hypothetical protein POJ06DRAFT_259958 [Lipomyces tetrasporus]
MEDNNSSSVKRPTATRSSRSVHFLPPPTLGHDNGSASGPLQPIQSVQEDGELGGLSDRIEQQERAVPQPESDERRLRSNSSVRRKFRGTRHLSLLSQNQKPAVVTETRNSDEPESDNVDNNTNSETGNDNVSPSTPARHRAKSEPAPPPLLKRFSGIVSDENGRARRPTLSAAGATIVVGITDPSPHPGVMAATMMSIIDVPGPREVVRRHFSAIQQAAPLDHPDKNVGEPVSVESEPLRQHLRVLIWTYLKLALKFVLTVKGFFITLYLCLVIAFGGMLFLILVGAAPAMNHPDGPDGTDSPGKRWIEIDSQVLNALFCITGFGLMPQRTKHLYFLIRGQLGNQETANVRLRKRYPWYVPSRNWWALAAVLYLYELNSCFQVVMAAGMWVYNRHNRPPWLTGMTIGLGFA